MTLKPNPSSLKPHYAKDIADQMAYATIVSPDDNFKSKKELRKERATQRKVSHDN